MRRAAMPSRGCCMGMRRVASVAHIRHAPIAHKACVQVRAGPTVLLTREQGKNDKMMEGLSSLGMKCIELPLIEHSHGADWDKLPAALSSGAQDWVAITSPEAAAVFLEAWNVAGRPEVRTTVVGEGTGKVLQAAGVEPAFIPSKATGKVLGEELPKVPGGNNVVLYPSSSKASSDLQDSLLASGYHVTRLNTYDTVGVTDVEPSLITAALSADVVTFGSPSAVKAWVALVGLQAASERLSVCIGSTSARACDKIGLPATRVYFPSSPGIPGWVESVVQACQENGLLAVSR